MSEEDVEHLEESVDTADLDEEELVSLDDAARALLAKPRRGHGPIARLYRGETRFDFVGKRRIWFSISTAIIVLGIVSIVLRGGLNLGIEFKGGTEWTIAAPGVTQTEATDAMKGTGIIDPTVQLLGTGSKQTLNVQSDINRLSQAQQDAVSQNVQKALLEVTAAHAPASPPTTTTTAKATTTTTARPGAATTTSAPANTSTTAPANAVPKPVADKISITTVGPTWGSSITNKAIEALIIFFVVVAIYISIRFEPKMALAAFIAMIHDVLVAVGIYSIFNFQVTPDTVVAILTILGYSLYDTVVVFDRVRDNTRGIGSSGRMTYPQLINLSMNQTLARSINTSMVAILPVLAVLLIGAQLLGATTLQSYGRLFRLLRRYVLQRCLPARCTCPRRGVHAHALCGGFAHGARCAPARLRTGLRPCCTGGGDLPGDPRRLHAPAVPMVLWRDLAGLDPSHVVGSHAAAVAAALRGGMAVEFYHRAADPDRPANPGRAAGLCA